MIKINLRHILEDRRLTQADLARITGIRPSTICDLCHNNSDFVKLEQLAKICEVLDCKIDEILLL